MNILMMTRYNFYKLDGGDKVQLLKTKEVLESRGHKVTIATHFIKNLKPYNIVHLFNMQKNPDSFLIYLLHAKKQHKPIALSTIYWNPKQWTKSVSNHYATNQAEKFTPFAGIPREELIKFIATSAELRKWFYYALRARGSGKAPQHLKETLVQQVDIILPNGKAEEELVKKDFGQFKKSTVIPNGVDDEFKNAKAAEFEKKYQVRDFILSVGRIETRKNTHILAQACAHLGLPLVLIGNDKAEPTYTSAVRQAHQNLIIIPHMPHKDLGGAYKAAKVHALASWFETPGLSNLEASVAGCNIVSTDVGPTKEYFGDMAWYCSPTSQKSVEKAIQDAFTAPRSPKLRQYLLKNFSWLQVGKLTEQAYKSILR